MESVIVPFFFYYFTPIMYFLYLINYKYNAIISFYRHQAARGLPTVRHPCCIGCRNIIRRIELIRYVNILQHLSNHRGFSYLTGTHNHLNKLSTLYKSILNRLIFSSFIHT